jgi:hypothetical protein
VKAEEPDSALLDADGHQQLQRDQTVGTASTGQQLDAEHAGDVTEGQQQQQQQAAGSELNGDMRSSPVASRTLDNGASVSGAEVSGEVEEGGAAAPALALPPAMLGGSLQANGGHASSFTALLNDEEAGGAPTGSIFSASAAGLGGADGTAWTAAAGAAAATAATGSEGRFPRRPATVSSPERVCAKRTRAHLVVPTEPGGDSCGAAGAEEAAPGGGSRKLPRRGEAAAGSGTADGPALVGPV